MEPETKPLWEHLEELRGRLIKCIAAVLVSGVAAYLWLDPLVERLLDPAGRLIFIHPTEAFLTRLKIAAFAGVFLALPVIFYQFWKFVLPALTPREVKSLAPVVAASYALFLFGVFFGYRFVLPPAMRFLLGFGGPGVEPRLAFGAYVSFAMNFLLAFGLAFQLPVAVFLLSLFGIVKDDFFARKRKTAVVAIFVASALLTPPDIFSQLMIALPALLLFELSVLLTRVTK
jgi:sec-independent protein translocase protein TatC